MNFKKLPYFALLALLFVMACNDDDDDMNPDPMDCMTEDITYTNFVEDILTPTCALVGCHASGSINGSLANYDDAVAFVGSRPIIAALRHEAGAEPMPQGFDKLEECTIDKIEAWINDGAPE